MESNADLDPAMFAALPTLPRDDDGPVFREPWEAQAFAMTLTLYEQGIFTWTEWAAALAAEIAPRRSRYRRNLLPSLAGGAGTHDHRRGPHRSPAPRTRPLAWDRAAKATPHGEPILLENDPEADGELSLH
jgi:hypothetical protein